MPDRPLASPIPMLGQQFRVEILRFIRLPAFTAISMGLPIMFFAFFGLSHVHESCRTVSCGSYLLASFAAYGFTSMMVFSFGIGVAVERGQRANVLLRATPLPPVVVIMAKVAAAAVFGMVNVAILDLFAFVVGGVRIDPLTWLDLTARLVVGSLPFIGLGFAIGYLSGPNTAPALANLIYLPMAFASGMFIPIDQLPDFIQKVAPYLPTYRYVRLVWGALGVPNVDSAETNLLYLLGFAVAFFVVAVRGYRREEKAQFS